MEWFTEQPRCAGGWTGSNSYELEPRPMPLPLNYMVYLLAVLCEGLFRVQPQFWSPDTIIQSLRLESKIQKKGEKTEASFYQLKPTVFINRVFWSFIDWMEPLWGPDMLYMPNESWDTPAANLKWVIGNSRRGSLIKWPLDKGATSKDSQPHLSSCEMYTEASASFLYAFNTYFRAYFNTFTTCFRVHFPLRQW